jgi:hypothetical protein
MSESPRARMRALRPIGVGIVIAALAAGSAYALAKSDPGAAYLHDLAAQSTALFGFGKPLDGGIKGTFDGPGDQAVELAAGLKAEVGRPRIRRPSTSPRPRPRRVATPATTDPRIWTWTRLPGLTAGSAPAGTTPATTRRPSEEKHSVSKTARPATPPSPPATSRR